MIVFWCCLAVRRAAVDGASVNWTLEDLDSILGRWIVCSAFQGQAAVDRASATGIHEEFRFSSSGSGFALTAFQAQAAAAQASASWTLEDFDFRLRGSLCGHSISGGRLLLRSLCKLNSRGL